MRARSVLILGASGFLGPHLVVAARRGGWRVIAASRVPGAAPRLEGIAPDEELAWDAEQPGSLERCLDSTRAEAVLVAAALSRVEACEREPERATLLNGTLPAEVARLCRARGLRCVHLSTDLVFGARVPRGERYGEEDPPAPVHGYGRSKAEGEALVRSADPAALVVRLPLLYGDSGGRGLGATDSILAALARGERPALFTDEWRTPLEAGNAARAVLELLAGSAHGLLHVAGPARVSRHELGLALLAARGFDGEAARARLRAVTRAELGLAGRPADVALDATRAHALLATPLLAPAAALAASLP